MSKSTRTQYRYRKEWQNQTKLDTFLQTSTSQEDTDSYSRNVTSKTQSKNLVRHASRSPDQSYDNPPPESRIGSEENNSIISDLHLLEDDDKIQTIEVEIEQMPDLNEADAEAWEEELDENTLHPRVEVRPWDVLRKKIKDNIKKNSKVLPLSQLNQLMILANFATLRLKGTSRIQASIEIAWQWHEGEGHWFARHVRNLARHYQIFEQLPKENRGGVRTRRSWLHDEDVRKHVQQYLSNLPTGKVTPKALVKHVDTIIFPTLGITPAKPLSIRTGCRWLIKLGWRHSLIKKGIYMDGHEREDVVKYRNEVFLPLMAEYENRMVHYEGPELRRIEPKLATGEKEIIPQFHDESCFHANDQTSRAW